MDDFLETFNSTPLGQKILFFVIIVVGLFAVYYLVLYGPLRSAHADAKKKLKTYKTKLKDARRKLNNQVSKEELLELQKKFSIVREKLPSQTRLPLLVEKIHNKAKTAGLEIQNFEQKSNKSKEIYVEIPVAMELKGTYGELIRFLNFVRNMSRIVNIQDLEMEVADRKTGELEISARATTYRYQKKKNGDGGGDDEQAN